ncbi:MAG TPA: hypothetical protein VFP84_28305 [Kofleriaceae bacterium]|nr:hypothetical protein [Kofleriaceae bacterium]
MNQIDLRASLAAASDEGVAGLARDGDFAGLDWRGIAEADREPVLLANPDGTFRGRRFFRDAAWMLGDSVFELEQLDAAGLPIGVPLFANTGLERERRASDGFFDRRLRAIQWTNDCRAPRDCTGAHTFEEEALVELRYAMRPDHVLRLAPQTAALRLRWTLRPDHPYTIPVHQIAVPQFAYGISVELEPVTPARGDGSYPAGSDITFRMTLKDGAGRRLHPSGSLPSFNEVINGPNPAGIQYYRAFFDPTTTYWRRKHRERMMMAQLIGPAQNVQPIRTVAALEQFLGPEDVQETGTVSRDGVLAQFHTFPTAHDLFGGAFDPAHVGWTKPVADTWTHHLPADAPSGTYTLTVKGRRTYMGQDIPYSKSITIQVGSPAVTRPTLTTGSCEACHNGPSALSNVLHGNDDRATCAACHVPLGFELEGPIYVRTHFIHARSRRFGAPLAACAVCHKNEASIQRTSKSACMSCHTSYPADHTVMFGPIESMYVGGGKESFTQCTSACHRSHPRSGL